MPAETLKGSFQNAMLASHNFREKIEKSFERLHYVEKNTSCRVCEDPNCFSKLKLTTRCLLNVCDKLIN